MSMNIEKLYLCCIIGTYDSVCYQQKQRVWLGYSLQQGDLVPLIIEGRIIDEKRPPRILCGGMLGRVKDCDPYIAVKRHALDQELHV